MASVQSRSGPQVNTSKMQKYQYFLIELVHPINPKLTGLILDPEVTKNSNSLVSSSLEGILVSYVLYETWPILNKSMRDLSM